MESTSKSRLLKPIVWSIALFAGVPLLLSALWRVPYIYSLLGVSGWAFIGHLITLDDDLPGGWSNPDGHEPTGWFSLVWKGVVFVGLAVAAWKLPALRSLGAG